MNINKIVKEAILEKLMIMTSVFLKNKITKEYTFKGYVNRKIIVKGELLQIQIRKYYDLTT